MEAAELSKVLDTYGGNSGLGRPFSAARMRTIERQLRKLEQVTHGPIAFVWLDEQNEAELRIASTEPAPYFTADFYISTDSLLRNYRSVDT